MTTIRWICPSGPVAEEALNAGLSAWSALFGETPIVPRVPSEDTLHYLAGNDSLRAEALIAALESRPEAIWMVRGGYGAIRTLEQCAQQLAPCDPTPLWGCSDGTALLATWRKLGWPAWHAPPLVQLPRLDSESLNRLVAARRHGEMAPFESLETLVPGTASGPLAGGNLCVLTSLVGTPWEASLSGAILFLEDVGEPAYKIDRLFTQLRLSGALAGIRGLLLGDFTAVSAREASLTTGFWDAVAPTLGVPVVRGFPVGHGARNAAIPMHRECRLEASATGSARLWALS